MFRPFENIFETNDDTIHKKADEYHGITLKLLQDTLGTDSDNIEELIDRYNQKHHDAQISIESFYRGMKNELPDGFSINTSDLYPDMLTNI